MTLCCKTIKTLILVFFLLTNLSIYAFGETTLEKEAYTALKKAAEYFYRNVSYHGGYLCEYTVDMKHRYGELPARESQIWVQYPSTPGVAEAFLNAWDTTDDAFFFHAAHDAIQALIWGQMDCGGWNYLIDFKGGDIEDWYTHEGNHPDFNEFSHFEWNATFDDRVTYAPTMLLLRIYNKTMDPIYLPSLTKALDFVLDAQFPNGAWPQRYPLICTRYDTYYTFNDDVINGNIDLMIHAYKTLGKPQYRLSAMRGADFIIASQHESPQYGWGQQYTYDMKLAPARAMEPAALSVAVTTSNVETLMDVYEFTGDHRYLEPISQALDWLDSVTSPDGTIGVFLEEDTNRPIAAKYVGDSGSYESIEYTYNLSEAMGGYGFVWKNFSTKPYCKRYERLTSTPWQEPTEKPSQLTKTEALSKAHAMENNVRQIIKDLDDKGRWAEDGRPYTKRFSFKNEFEYEGPVMKNYWIRTGTFIRNMNTLSEYLRLMKITQSEK